MGLMYLWGYKSLTIGDESSAVFIGLAESVHIIRHSSKLSGTLAATKGPILTYECHIKKRQLVSSSSWTEGAAIPVGAV